MLFPPPPPSVLRLSGFDSTRAGDAADRSEPAIVQGMIGNVVLADERHHPLAGPIEQRIDPDHAVTGRDDGKRSADTHNRLIRPQACDPGDRVCERASERLDPADGAAGVTRAGRAIESIDSLTAHQGFHSAAVGICCKNAPTVAVLSLRPHHKRFWEQPTGVEGHHVDCETLAEDRMSDRLVLQAKARGEDDAAGNDAADRDDTLIEIEAGACVR